MEKVTKNSENPFEGLKRKRLPGMHLITALEGGVPLRAALAAFFFTMLHDHFKHDCLIQVAKEELDDAVASDTKRASSSDDMALSGVFGMMAKSGLAGEEWSYLDSKDALIFFLIADTAIEQVQRWISEGKHQPYEINKGCLVERAAWTFEHFNGRVNQKSIDYVENLSKEIVL